MRPPDLLRVVVNFFGILDAWYSMIALLRNSCGSVTAEEKTFVPESEWAKVVRGAHPHRHLRRDDRGLAYHRLDPAPATDRAAARLYGCWHMVLTGPAAAYRLGG